MSEPTDSQSPNQQYPSQATSESTLSSVPSDSSDNFSSLHLSLAPPVISQRSGSLSGSTENSSSAGSSPTMSDKKQRPLLPPSYPQHGSQTQLSTQMGQSSWRSSPGSEQIPVTETKNPAYIETGSAPLPNYETLFPQKRHGVQGHAKWDHIIAEVNQRHRDSQPELVGPEMSVDGPEEPEPNLQSFQPPDTSPFSQRQTRPQDAKSASLKKEPSPASAKKGASAHHGPVTASSQRLFQGSTHPRPIITKPSLSAIQETVITDTSSKDVFVVAGDGESKVHPSLTKTQISKPNSRTGDAVALSQHQRQVQDTVSEDVPIAKPRTRASELVNYNEFDITPVASDFRSDVDRNGWQPKFDPFPTSDLLSKDPWAQMTPHQDINDPFSSNANKEQKPEDQGMTAFDLDKIFAQDSPANPFANLSGSDSTKQEYSKKDVSNQHSPAFQRQNSQRRKLPLPSVPQSHKTGANLSKEPAYKEKSSTANQDLAKELQSPADANMQTRLYREKDLFGADPFAVPSSSLESPVLTTPVTLPIVMENSASQSDILSVGKTPLQVWVSPSEVQPVSAQNSSGGVLASTPRRPHPVKPMNTVENQPPTSTTAFKDINIRDSTAGKIKMAETVESGPYGQLTQEELITLVVKQQADLSSKDAKISELEEYIDNLLVRVIEEKPTILQSLNINKPL